MKCAHTTVYRGKRVLVRLKDGTKFIDRFKDSTHTQIIFESHARVCRQDMKSMSIYKEPAVRWLPPFHHTIHAHMAKEMPNNCPCVNDQYDLCGQPLEDGHTCPAHGKIKTTPYEKPDDEKKEANERAGRLFKTPPRRVKDKHTRPKRFLKVGIARLYA